MSKPLWVQVIWSESSEFKDDELVFFPKFENRAHMVAMSHSTDGGYYKTKINVLFDNGDEYACRLDLAPADTLCFEDHCKQLINYYENKGNMIQEYKTCYEFLKQIDWS